MDEATLKKQDTIFKYFQDDLTNPSLWEYPLWITLAAAPAPTSKVLEDAYYPQPDGIARHIQSIF